MHYGLSLPPHGDYANLSVLLDLAVRAERSGWDGFFLWDHLLFMKEYRGPIIDPWIALAAVATLTKRMRLGPLVTPLPRRRPWKVAREAVTLDHLSGGRLILGVGLGYPRDSEFEMFGEEGSEAIRAEKLDEGLTILSGLWSGESLSFDGKHYQLADVRFEPLPLQAPRIPIWVGGYWPNKGPFRRAARWDGVFPGRLTLERRARWSPNMMSVREFRSMINFVSRHRDSMTHFDYVLGGYTSPRNGVEDRSLIESYESVGLTWWIENLHEFRGPLNYTTARIEAGPPR